MLELYPAYEEFVVRVSYFGDKIEKITKIDPVSREKIEELDELMVFPARHYNAPLNLSYDPLKKIEKEYVQIQCDEKASGQELPSPKDRIKESNIELMQNKVIIYIKGANWRKYIDSNSMDPLIDEGTTTLEIKPNSPDDIKIGDIIE